MNEMNKVLVVANKTVVSANLTKRLYELSQQGPISVQIVMPQDPMADGPGFTPSASPEGSMDRANRNLWAGIRAISKLGLAVTGQIGPADPMAAVKMMTDQYDIDTVLVSSLPLGTSRWLAMDLPHRLGRRFPHCDVQHVTGYINEEPRNTVAPGEHVNVLLVEDNELDVELAMEALDRCSYGVDLTVTSDGAEALKYLKNANSGPHLVLLDLKMPTIDGHEFLRRLQTDLSIDALNELFVAVVSSSSADKDRREAHALGARAYVVKSPSFDLFSDSLSSVVNEVAFGRVPTQVLASSSRPLAYQSSVGV